MVAGLSLLRISGKEGSFRKLGLPSRGALLARTQKGRKRPTRVEDEGVKGFGLGKFRVFGFQFEF